MLAGACCGVVAVGGSTIIVVAIGRWYRYILTSTGRCVVIVNSGTIVVITI